MENKGNGNYDQKSHNSNENNSHKYDSQSNKEEHQSRNAVDVKAPGASQRSPENGRDSNTPDSHSGSFNAINRNNENPEDYQSNKDNLMPNPDDFDEGDDQDSEGKGERTPGL